jgi:hypothetical protein
VRGHRLASRAPFPDGARPRLLTLGRLGARVTTKTTAVDASRHDAARILVERVAAWFLELQQHEPLRERKQWSPSPSDFNAALALLRARGWSNAVEAVVGFVAHHQAIGDYDARVESIEGQVSAYAAKGRSVLAEFKYRLPSPDEKLQQLDSIDLAGACLWSSWKGASVRELGNGIWPVRWVTICVDQLPDPAAPFIGEQREQKSVAIPKVEGIKALREIFIAEGLKVGSDPAAVRNLARKMGVLTKGSNPKKGPIVLDEAEVLTKVRAHKAQLASHRPLTNSHPPT